MHRISPAATTRLAKRDPPPRRLRTFAPTTHVDRETAPILIDLQNVGKVFGSRKRCPVTAIEGISFSIPRRTLTLIRGPSGSGKTTLLGIIGCMMRPTSGRVTVAGRDLTRVHDDLLADMRRTHVGFVFQSRHLIHRATALENVMVPAIPRRDLNGDLRTRARSLLARMGLGSKAHRRVHDLSGGEQQRVAIARALINDPDIILADEPTAHLDSSSADDFMELAFGFLAHGKSVVIASHDPAARAVGAHARVVELRDGRLV